MSLPKNSLPSAACIVRVDDHQSRSMVAEFTRPVAQQVHEDLLSALPTELNTDSFNKTLKMVVKTGQSATLFAAALADDNSGRIYAVKTRSPKDKDLAQDELAVLKAMRNANDGQGLPFCARLLSYFETSPGRPALVFEVHRGSLGDLVNNRHRPIIEPTQMYVWAAQLVSGASHMHKAGIVHRNIKPSNIMVDRDGALVISDPCVGHVYDKPTSRLRSARKLNVVCGNVTHMAPEMLLEKRYDERVDAWGVGITLSELAGEHPFMFTFVYNPNLMVIFEPKLVHCSRYGAKFESLVRALLVKNFNRRLRIRDAKKHVYFSDISIATWKAMSKPFADVPYLLGVDLGAHPVYEQLRSLGGLLQQEIQDGDDPAFARHRQAARRLAGFETDSETDSLISPSLSTVGSTPDESPLDTPSGARSATRFSDRPYSLDIKALVKAVWATAKSNSEARSRRSIAAGSAVEVYVPAM